MNVLIAGSHSGMVDTLIIAHIDPEARKITLISVPRDLYYNGRKINFLHSLYGMAELRRALAFVTGFEIDKYILIDMYAFIDAIDLIGGIDVRLDEPVIDPSYKTFDGGQWGTLYYRAGDHHLSGKQALRLARTRHTTSDFARSGRQHLILQAIQDKAKNFGLGDAMALKTLASTILEKTETDIGLAEALSYYFRYQNFTIDGSHVLSTDNVLVSKFTNDDAFKAAECPPFGGAPDAKKEECSKFDRGEYILLPKDDNWNAVRWYFRKLINLT